MKKYVVVFTLLLSACAMSPNSHFYQLQAQKNDVAISNRSISVGIEEVDVPQYIDRPQIVLIKKNSSELSVSEFHRWAEPLTSSITRILADDISTFMPKSVIKPQSYTMEQFNFTINVEINKFDAELNDKVTLDAWWTIYRNGKNVARGRSTLDAPAGDTYDSIVNAQSNLINEMAKQIAQKLSKL
ncbi:MAG: membrane integrity-associated transporter subunit PqiC [Alphaproteobacteria bacterium]|nr:membrane integrity-associated transporter subunit PqiC [Alphaproteobacteria bacterium]